MPTPLELAQEAELRQLRADLLASMRAQRAAESLSGRSVSDSDRAAMEREQAGGRSISDSDRAAVRKATSVSDYAKQAVQRARYEVNPQRADEMSQRIRARKALENAPDPRRLAEDAVRPYGNLPYDIAMQLEGTPERAHYQELLDRRDRMTQRGEYSPEARRLRNMSDPDYRPLTDAEAERLRNNRDSYSRPAY